MRNVAVALAVMTLISALPLAFSADECANPGSGSFCKELPLARPSSPPGVPSVPDTVYWDTYYLWIGVGHCTGGVTTSDCRSWPARDGSGVPLPTGGAIPSASLFGVLFQESNGATGLQRFFTSRPADHMVLI